MPSNILPSVSPWSRIRSFQCSAILMQAFFSFDKTPRFFYQFPKLVMLCQPECFKDGFWSYFIHDEQFTLVFHDGKFLKVGSDNIASLSKRMISVLLPHDTNISGDAVVIINFFLSFWLVVIYTEPLLCTRQNYWGKCPFRTFLNIIFI